MGRRPHEGVSDLCGVSIGSYRNALRYAGQQTNGGRLRSGHLPASPFSSRLLQLRNGPSAETDHRAMLPLALTASPSVADRCIAPLLPISSALSSTSKRWSVISSAQRGWWLLYQSRRDSAILHEAPCGRFGYWRDAGGKRQAASSRLHPERASSHGAIEGPRARRPRSQAGAGRAFPISHCGFRISTKCNQQSATANCLPRLVAMRRSPGRFGRRG